MSNEYKIIKHFYDLGIYTKEKVHLFVDAVMITESDYDNIVERTGNPEYDAILNMEDDTIAF